MPGLNNNLNLKDKNVIYLSASQLKTAQLCKRKWAFEKIDKAPRTTNAAAELGQRVHTILEAWRRDNTPPDLKSLEGKIAAQGLTHLPPPSSTETVEQYFEMADGQLNWRGFIDLYDAERGIILDYKTTGWLRYALTPQKLVLDIQANIYAENYFRERPGASSVELRWIYFGTKLDGAFSVNATLERDTCAENHTRAIKQGERLLSLTEQHSEASTVHVQFPNEGCNAFGGCPFVSKCEAIQQTKKESFNVDLLAQLKAKKNAAASPSTESVPSEPARDLLSEMKSAPVNPPAAAKPAPKKRAKKKAAIEKPLVGEPVAIDADAFPTPTVSGFVLLVGCVSRDAQDLTGYVAKAAQNAADAAEPLVNHYREIPYGAGVSALHVSLSEMLKAEPLVGLWSMPASGQLYVDARAALTEAANVVIVGTL